MTKRKHKAPLRAVEAWGIMDYCGNVLPFADKHRGAMLALKCCKDDKTIRVRITHIKRARK